MVSERIREAKKFYENGLVGLIEDEGNILYPAKYEQIEICRDLIFMIKPDGISSMYQPGTTETAICRRKSDRTWFPSA